LHADITKLVVWKLQEIIEKAKVMQDFERGGMDSVTSKIAQKIRVFFENQHFDAGAGEEISEHHSCRAATGDAATHVEFLNGSVLRHGRQRSLFSAAALGSASDEDREIVLQMAGTNHDTRSYLACFYRERGDADQFGLNDCKRDISGKIIFRVKIACKLLEDI